MCLKFSFKRVFIIVLICFLIISGRIILNYKNPAVKLGARHSIYNSIYDNNHKDLKLISFNNEFDISYIENTNHNSINPSFPAIHITTLEEHNAWIHIVYTDAKDASLQLFVDADKDAKNYPFYTLEQDFFDAPLWSYNLWSKPLSSWKGHAYAIKVDHVNKTIKCVGGIKWGFKLSYFSFKPQMIIPLSLALQDFENDWIIFQTKLGNYRNISRTATCDKDGSPK